MAETKVDYKVKVINIKTHLNIRNGAGTTHTIIGKRNNNDTFMVDRSKTLPDGSVWYREKGENKWSCAKTSGNTKYIKVVKNMNSGSGKPPKEDKTRQPKIKKVDNNQPKKTDNTKADSNKEEFMGLPNSTMTYSIIDEGPQADDPDTSIPDSWMFHYVVRKRGYPKADKGDGSYKISVNDPNNKGNSGYGVNYFTYNYSTWDTASEDKYKKKLAAIKKSINAPTAWTGDQLYKMTFMNFNRFKMDFPDINLKGTRAAVFVTRPSLNLLMSSGNGVAILDKKSTNDTAGNGVLADIRIYNLLKENLTLGELLSNKKRCSSAHGLHKHNFNPLLSNQAYSLDVQDDQVEALETGETVTGYKIQYSKHSNKSVAMGSVTIKYKELFDLSITKLHQIWVDYQSDVYKGVLDPQYKYIWKRELDYLCNIYYFLLAEDGETILFWSKYYGCFPVNVPKSTFSYDRGSQVAFPEVNVTYNYICKEDLSPQALVEFNEDSGIKSGATDGKYKYVPIYKTTKNGGTLHTGTTWVGLPFIQTVPKSDKLNEDSYGLKLRFREK